jgi:hypothetical protein
LYPTAFMLCSSLRANDQRLVEAAGPTIASFGKAGAAAAAPAEDGKVA